MSTNLLPESLLENRGYGHLKDLLKKKNEISLFEAIRNYTFQKEKNSRIPNLEILDKYRIKISFLSPSKMFIICCHGQLTPIGKIINSLYQSLEKRKIKGYVFLTSGGAKETLKIKPQSKLRLNLKFKDFVPQYSNHPRIDGDFLLITNCIELTEEEICRWLREEIKNNPLEVKVIASKSRPFIRVDLGKVYDQNHIDDIHWGNYWQSWGHIVSPEYCGKHSFRYTFLQNLMGVNDSYPYILISHQPRTDRLLGTYIDFFPEHHKYKEITYKEGLNSLGRLKPALLNWFEISFPQSSPPEALCHLLHCLKNVTWDNQLILSPQNEHEENRKVLFNRSPLNSQRIKKMAKGTSLRLAKEIIHPISQNSKLIVKNDVQALQWNERTFRALEQILNGDPYLGLIYLLSAGENPTDAPVYGTGFIDPKGFFPELYEFLHTGDRLNRLIKLMAKTEEGPAMKGWPAFLNFIYSETGFDLKKTAKLLNPNFCSMETYPTLVEDFISPDLKKPSLPFEPPSEVLPIST